MTEKKECKCETMQYEATTLFQNLISHTFSLIFYYLISDEVNIVDIDILEQSFSFLFTLIFFK